uniref:Uncharacterized protein n=1 Tax=Chrysotila carterae TaxID=13221 RepID=A0A7S4BPK4_CHRCT|mmetsp:Transcript_2285/g.4777  ORF Transcript_2285/g.4777 Transcript_2285/m.4777 type:complete len:262 (+) Transcript_2285:211-996(+)
MFALFSRRSQRRRKTGAKVGDPNILSQSSALASDAASNHCGVSVEKSISEDVDVKPAYPSPDNDATGVTDSSFLSSTDSPRDGATKVEEAPVEVFDGGLLDENSSDLTLSADLELLSKREPSRAGECKGLRMLVGSHGFCLLQPSGGMVYATCEQVLAELTRPSARLRPLSVETAEAIVAIGEKLKAGRVTEAEAGRKILVLVGPTIECAVVAAVGRRSNALARARQHARKIAAAGQLNKPAESEPLAEGNEGGTSSVVEV